MARASRIALACAMACCAFAFAFALAFAGWNTAFAGDGIVAASIAPEDATSAELSDDGKDYGWLYRKGDYWYAMGTSSDDVANALYVQYMSRIYDIEKYTSGDYLKENTGLVEVFYSGGTICYQCGEQVCMDAIVRGENPKCWTRGDWAMGDDTPGPLCVYVHAATLEEIKHVVFDASVKARFHADGVTADYDYTEDKELLYFFNGLFDGCSNLKDVKGLEYLYTDEVAAMPRMFAGCEQIEELDLTAFNTAKCSDFADMFEDCSSLITLKFGDGWTQENIGSSGHSGGAKAVFPVDMRCDSGNNIGFYEAGTVIPDGAGEYVASGSTDVRTATVTLLPQSGDGKAVSVEQSDGELPAFEYTGSEVKPAVTLEANGVSLQEGVDFTVAYKNNVEDGTAQVVISGKGECFGCAFVPFSIVDTGAYALLYENGLMVLKAGHGLPNKSFISSSEPLSATMRWFDVHTADPGASVPWADKADKVERIIVDKSFAQFKPITAARWFAGCSSLSSIEGFENIDTSAMTSVAGMFAGCSSIDALLLKKFETSHLIDFSGFLSGCSSLEYVRLADGGLASAENLDDFFAGCESLESMNLNFLNGCKAENLSGLFKNCTSLAAVKVGKADLSVVKNASNMFAGCTSLENLNLSQCDLSKATTLDGMFDGCTSLVNVNLASCDLSSAESLAGLFKGCSSLATVDLQSADLRSATSLSGMFRDCSDLASANLGKLNASSAKDVSGMFDGCTSLTSVNVVGMSVLCAEDFSRFLGGCSSLSDVDFTGVATPAAKDFTEFVDGCTALTALNLGDLDAVGATGLDGIVTACPKLETLKTGQGWRNAQGALQPLTFAKRTYRTWPLYACLEAGTAIPDGQGEYRVSGVGMQFATVVMEASSFECTGKAITPKITVKLGDVVLQDGVDYTVTYENNVHVGTATAVVMGKGALVGGLKVPFTITPEVTHVGDRIVYTQGKVTYTLEVTSVEKSSGKVTGAQVRIIDVKVNSSKLKTLSLPSQCTIGGVTTTVTAVSAKLTGAFRNVRTVIISPNVVIIGARAFAKAPKVKKLIIQSARLKSVKNCLKGSKVKRVVTNVYLTKSKRSKYKKMFTKKAGKRGIRFIYG